MSERLIHAMYFSADAEIDMTMQMIHQIIISTLPNVWSIIITMGKHQKWQQKNNQNVENNLNHKIKIFSIILVAANVDQ